ncbi:MAG: biliverdin-producing heme oxygenase [Armatimonadota bacterium]
MPFELPLPELLREETRREHDRLEQRIDLLRPDFSPAEYRALLARFLGYYEPLERGLAAHPWAELGHPLQPGERPALLARDLGVLGLSREAISALPRCGAVPDVGDLSRAAGALYVLEGAALGGQVVARHLRRTPLLRELPAAFFGSDGADVGARWRKFRALLEELGRSRLERGMVIDGARATFRRLDDWLAERSPA